MTSQYWDDFERRINETVIAIRQNKKPQVRRVAVFITNQCNFKCDYCNVYQDKIYMSLNSFDKIVNKYGKNKNAIIHITGGEPSIVPGLYDYIDSREDVRFHLNTNLFIQAPMNIKRLKVSLDSNNAEYFDSITHRKHSFDKVVKNIKEISCNCSTSITCTLTRENYKSAPNFMYWCRKEFPNIYAVFFSVYKGTNKRFVFTKQDSHYFFYNILPELKGHMDRESKLLINETIDEKKRIIQGVRFPENKNNNKCYLSMSERVFDPSGNKWYCSHLYRDNVLQKGITKHSKCLYGCNRRLIAFNEEVERKLLTDGK